MLSASIRSSASGRPPIWLARRKDAARFSLRFDIVAVLPHRLPQHFIDAF